MVVLMVAHIHTDTRTTRVFLFVSLFSSVLFHRLRRMKPDKQTPLREDICRAPFLLQPVW